ncbi:hypothetical protein B0H11DRAFT_2080075 [Mycena galericulata]|nr:hypothetical protein B0H11DRAFT_2080075 [Mycena galericulata]
MLFSNALLVSASLAALIIPGALAIPSPDSGTPPDATTKDDIISSTTNIVGKWNGMANAMGAIVNANPNNNEISTTTKQFNAVRNKLALSNEPLTGVIGSCIGGNGGVLSGLGLSDVLGGLLAGTVSELLDAIVSGLVAGLLDGLLGGLLGGLNLSGLITELLGSLGTLQAGGCPTILITNLLTPLQGLVAELLGLVSLGSSCGSCSSDTEFLGTLTGLLGGLLP